MTTKQIDLLNIGLMALSVIAAFVVPFELFLFSYAILGPLHYLTEITWLHKRNYFTPTKYAFVWLGVLCIFTTLFAIVFTEYADISNLLIFVAFVSSLGIVVFKQFLHKLLLTALAFFTGMLVIKSPTFFFTFGVFLPTLIHVFLFTGLFMISGAVKTKSTTGFAAMFVFILCAIACVTIPIKFGWYSPSAYAERSMIDSEFIKLNQSIIYLLNLGEMTRDFVFESTVGLGIMRFIAFAYTYHYLNWFSKTSVIKWHEVPKHWLVTVVTLWLLSIGVYLYDYHTGLMTLYFLSMMHVFLEFPLNYRSVQLIVEGINFRPR